MDDLWWAMFVAGISILTPFNFLLTFNTIELGMEALFFDGFLLSSKPGLDSGVCVGRERLKLPLCYCHRENNVCVKFYIYLFHE